MINFSKNANCPSSQGLLAFQQGETSDTENKDIGGHLQNCEFCAAEVEFYARCPQAEGGCTVTEIPFPLFELARRLLDSEQENYRRLNRMLKRREYPTFVKA